MAAFVLRRRANARYDPCRSSATKANPARSARGCASARRRRRNPRVSIVRRARRRGRRRRRRLRAAAGREFDYGAMRAPTICCGLPGATYRRRNRVPRGANLIGTPDAALEDIVEVRSHPVALEQSGGSSTNFRVATNRCHDTAAAVARVVEQGDTRVAAVASAFAADYYGARMLRLRGPGRRRNYTRFYLVEGRETRALAQTRPRLRRARTAGAGELRDGLSAFADAEINSVRSYRGRRTGLQVPVLLRDRSGGEERLRAALDAIDGEAKILGIY